MHNPLIDIFCFSPHNCKLFGCPVCNTPELKIYDGSFANFKLRTTVFLWKLHLLNEIRWMIFSDSFNDLLNEFCRSRPLYPSDQSFSQPQNSSWLQRSNKQNKSKHDWIRFRTRREVLKLLIRFQDSFPRHFSYLSLFDIFYLYFHQIATEAYCDFSTCSVSFCIHSNKKQFV